MHFLKGGAALTASLFLFSQFTTLVSAGECCDCPASNQCPDGTGCSSKWSCCGKGPCNIFCCNCDDGCRSKSSASRLHTEKVLNPFNEDSADCMDTLNRVDANRDGIISFLEWAEYDNAHYGEPWEKLALRWALFDVEGKGYMTSEEAFNRKAS